jgi:hypothetical protein
MFVALAGHAPLPTPAMSRRQRGAEAARSVISLAAARNISAPVATA